MLVYIVMTVLSCALTAMASRTGALATGLSAGDARLRRLSLFLAVCSALPLLLVSALRWNIGTDYSYTYAPEYEALRWALSGQPKDGVGLLTSVENALIHAQNAAHAGPFFYQLELFLIGLGADVQWLFAVVAVLTLVPVFYSIYRQSVFPALSVFLFVCTGNFFLSLNIMRQYAAIALCLVALEPAQRRDLPGFLAPVLLASLLHTSALVCLPLYALARVRIRPSWSLALIAAALLLSPLIRWALEAAVPMLLPQYAWYFNSGHDQNEFETLFLLINLAVLALAAVYYKAGRDKPYFALHYNANLLGALALCLSGALPLMKRINFYFAAAHFLFLPLLLSLEGDARRRRALTALVCLAFVAETVVAVAMLEKNQVYPYTAIWARYEVPYFNWAR